MYCRKNEKNQKWFWLGLRLSFLAVLLLMASPLVDAVHRATCGHQHDIVADNGSIATGHEACCHEWNFHHFLQNGKHHDLSKHSPSGMGHDPLHCSVCQSLRVLGTPFTFLAPPSLLLPTDSGRIPFLVLNDSLLPHFPHSGQPRAPPLA
jgi:hypothetical protein